MKDHVPDLERCKRLQEKGFPQESILLWCCHGNNEACVEYGKVDCELSTGGCAAPIVTELVGEIRKLMPYTPLYKGDPLIEMSIGEDGICRAWAYLSNTCKADTLPNALADLWMWLREREP